MVTVQQGASDPELVVCGVVDESCRSVVDRNGVDGIRRRRSDVVTGGDNRRWFTVMSIRWWLKRVWWPEMCIELGLTAKSVDGGGVVVGLVFVCGKLMLVKI
ncbi:hypothetical protein Hanom_Chr00s000003g01605731 [Helianthus anomalus]